MSRQRHSFTLGDVVRENARGLPDQEALVCGDTRLTFRGLAERVDRTAALLGAAGVRPGDRVGWLGYGCHRTVEALLACAKLAAVFAPLNWRLAGDELAWTVGQVAPRVLVLPAAAELAGAAGVARSAAPGVPVLVADDPAYERELASVDPVDPHADNDDEMPVLELFTAAFTGRPRGALLHHRGIVTQNLVLAALRQIDVTGEVYLASGPMFHIGVLLKLFATLHLGGRTVIVPKVDAGAVCRAVQAERCTSAFLFTPTIGEIVELNADRRFDLSSLRAVPGAPPEPARAAWYAMTSCTPPEGSGLVGYGQTETIGMVTFSDRLPLGIGAMGRPSPVAALRIVDERRREVPDGEVGEIAVRGPQLMLGYHDEDPGERSRSRGLAEVGTPPAPLGRVAGAASGGTADRDREPDLTAGPETGGWHFTNDLGRREADGTVSFLGPKLDLIKTGMENVYPAEVENVLRRHPAVADACVIGTPDPVWGESVRAVVQPGPDATVDADELVAFVRRHIASYKKPRTVVVVDALPRIGAAVDRAEVKRRWAGR